MAPVQLFSRRPGGLLRQPAFRRLWAGNALSQLGTQVSQLAVPLVAISTLRSSTVEVALLTTLESVAFLLIGLPAGVWTDRMRRRPILVAADLGRALLLAAIPIAYALHGLHIALLYVVVFLVGVLTVFFDVCYQSFLPAVVSHSDLVEGNGKLEANRSVAKAAGPAFGGYLVQLLTAPMTMIVDAASYLWSAAWILRIQVMEKPSPASGNLRAEIGKGLRLVLGHRLLRPIALYGATYLLFSSAKSAILIVFLARTVGAGPTAIGLLFGIGNLAAVAGALCATRLATRFGQGRALLGVTMAGGLFGLFLPLTSGGWGLAFFAVGVAGTAFSVVVFNVIQVSFRQGLCPSHLLGRMNATMRFMLWMTMPIGSAAGGVIASDVGLRPTLLICAVGGVLATGLLFASPLRRVRDLGE